MGYSQSKRLEDLTEQQAAEEGPEEKTKYDAAASDDSMSSDQQPNNSPVPDPIVSGPGAPSQAEEGPEEEMKCAASSDDPTSSDQDRTDATDASRQPKHTMSLRPRSRGKRTYEDESPAIADDEKEEAKGRFSRRTRARVVVKKEETDEKVPDSVKSEEDATDATKPFDAIVKEELTPSQVRLAQCEPHRLYGNRYLLHRHDENGIARLGGNIFHASPKPGHKNEKLFIEGYPVPKHLKTEDLKPEQVHQDSMDDFVYQCLDDLWHKNAPKYAGQPFGAVNHPWDAFVKPGKAVPVFIKRTRTGRAASSHGALLGWEYCGNYRKATAAEAPEYYENALNMSLASRQQIAKKVYLSSLNGDGYGRSQLAEWRERLTKEVEELEREESLKGDLSHETESDKKKRLEAEHPSAGGPQPSLAKRARALGYKETISDEALAHLIVNLNEYHKQTTIEFVEYDQRVYDFCQGGKTTRNALGKKADKDPAKAQDWYDFHDTMCC